MSFLRPIQWYHSHADPIWPDGTFKLRTMAFLLTGLDFLSAAATQHLFFIFWELEGVHCFVQESEIFQVGILKSSPA